MKTTNTLEMGNPVETAGAVSLRIDQLIKISMESLTLIVVALSPWLCPQECILPAWTGISGSINAMLAFYSVLAMLLVLWAGHTLVARQLTWSKCSVAVGLGGLVLLGMWQATPLPHSLRDMVAPATARMHEALVPTQKEIVPETELTGNKSSPVGSTISLDAEATRRKAVQFLALFLLFAIVRNSIPAASALRRLSIVVGINGVLLAFYGLYRFFDPPKIKSYLSIVSTNPIFGPFLYRNHFAFYINICLGLALGLLFAALLRSGTSSSRRRERRRGSEEYHGETSSGSLLETLKTTEAPWIIFGASVMLAGIVFSQSRGGLITTVLALVLTMGVKVLITRRFAGIETIAVLLLVFLGVASWLGFDWARSRVATTDKAQIENEGRLLTWHALVPLMRQFPVWGTGYGTYYDVEKLHRTSADHFKQGDGHAFNEFLEAQVEGGIGRLLLSLAVVGAVYGYAFRAFRHYQNEPTGGLVIGALLAFTTVVIHSFVEFGIHNPAIAFLVTLIAAYLSALGTASTATATESESSENRGNESATVRLGGAAPIAGAVIALGLGVLLVGIAFREQKVTSYVRASLSSEFDNVEELERKRKLLETATRVMPDLGSAHAELGHIHYATYERLLVERKQRGDLADFCQAIVNAGAERLIAAATPAALVTELSWVPAHQVRDLSMADEAKPWIQKHIYPSLRYYLRARDLSPLLVKSHLGIAVNVDYLRQADSFESYVNRAKQLRPADPDLWYLCGVVELQHHCPELAWSSWRHSLELSKSHFIEIITQASKQLDAPELLAKVLPDNPDMILEATFRLFPPSEPVKRQLLLQKALALYDQKPNLTPEELHNKARIYATIGPESEVQGTLEKALRFKPQEAGWRYELADHLFAQGKFAECRKHLIEVLSQQPQNTAAREMVLNVTRLLASTQGTDRLFSEGLKDFGVVPRGTILKHEFKLENTTGAPVEIVEARTSCGCATVNFPREPISPGQAAAITLTVDTNKYSGPRTFTIFLKLSKPISREVVIAARAQSRDDLSVTPSQLDLGSDPGSRGTVTVEGYGHPDWKITGIESIPAELTATVREVERSKEKAVYHLDVALKSPGRPGSWVEEIVLSSNDVSAPRIRVPVSVTAALPLSISPSEVVLNSVAVESETTRKILLRGLQPFTIKSVEGGDDHCQLDFNRDEKKNIQILVLKFQAGKQTGPVDRRFRIITDLPENNVAEFHFSATVVAESKE